MRVARALVAAALLACAHPGRSPREEAPSPASRILAAFRAGEFERAERLLAEAEGAEPTVEHLEARARLLASRGETGPAIGALETALADPRLPPEDAVRLHRAAARIGLEAGDFEKAAAHARAAGAREGDEPLLRTIAGFDARPYRVIGPASGPVPLRVGPLAEAPVRLNDAVESLFVLDTGASLTVLSRSLARRAGVEVLAGEETAVDPSGRSIGASVGRLGAIEIGAARIEGVPVLLVDDERLAFRLLGLFTVFRAEGAIGLGLLRRFRAAIDLDAGTLELSPPGGGDGGGIPLRAVDGVLYASASAAGQGARAFLLDTGADRSSLSELGAAALERRVPIVAAPGRGASAGGTTFFLRRAEGVILDLGGARLGPLDLPVWGSGREGGVERFGTIGLDALRGRRTVLEPGVLRLILEARSPGS